MREGREQKIQELAGDPIVNVLYPNSNDAGPMLLMFLGLASVFVCISLITTAVLQATGHELCPVWSMLAGGVTKVAVNWFLIAVPELNIVGAPIGTLACYVVICIMNYIFLCRTLHERLHIGRCLARPLLTSVNGSVPAVSGLPAAAQSSCTICARVASISGETVTSDVPDISPAAMQ